MRWITATQLNQWADNAIFEGLLPLLIRKLIVASCKEFPDLHIPAGDSVFKPGWDGRCSTKEKALLVPKGASYWEFGRDKTYAKKFNAEFSKRTPTTSIQDQKKSTFVFVTPRRWTNPERKKLLSDLKDKSKWKDIIIYDADDLETWLEQCPAIGRWVANEFNIPTDKVLGADEFWRGYIIAKDFPVTPDFIIAGRLQQVEDIQEFIKNEKGKIELQSSSPDEAIMFTISSLLKLEINQEDQWLSKAVVVKNKNSIAQLSSSHSNLIIIYDNNKNEPLTELDVKQGHLISVINLQANTIKNTIQLPVPKTEKFAEELYKTGMSYDDAYRLTSECGKNHNVLRRKLNGTTGRLASTQSYDAQDLIPIFLIQSFDDEKEEDKKVVSLISRKEYGTYKDVLKKWILVADAPIRQIANLWQIVSAYEMLFIVAKYVTEEHLTQFKNIIYEVMFEIDPALELEPDSRYAAKIFNKDSKYSKQIKEGICQTFALISVHGNDAGINTSINISSWADEIVKNLLSKTDLASWQSIQSKIDLLAEASPNSFLSTVDNLINNHAAILTSLFDDQGTTLFSPNYYVHLLKACEALAWDESYFTKVMLILAKFQELDIGNKYANRPSNSLAGIFRWWLPQTFASIKKRKEAIDLLIKRSPKIAFDLLLKLTPDNKNGSYSYRPLWRWRDISTQKVTYQEVYEGYEFTCIKLIQLASNDPSSWSNIIGLVDDYRGDLRKRVIDGLAAITFSSDTEPLRERLRQIISIHEHTRDKSRWKLTIHEQQRLKKVYQNLSTSIEDRFAWYFNERLINEAKTDLLSFEEQLVFSNKKRKKALKEILKEAGLDGVFNLANKVDKSDLIGNSLAEIYKDNDSVILDRLIEVGKIKALVMGYIEIRYNQIGLSWLLKKVKYYTVLFPDKILARFFLSVEGSPRIWEYLETISPIIKDCYWNNLFNEYPTRVYSEHLDACIIYLNEYRRFSTSLNLIHDLNKISTERIIECLSGYVTDNNESNVELYHPSYRIPRLFKKIKNDNISADKMAMLEWSYFQVLNDEEPSLVTHLFDNLSKNPEFFAQLISFLYKPESNSGIDTIDNDQLYKIKKRAENALSILKSWKKVPGLDETGVCNFTILKEYILKAVKLCEVDDRKHAGLYQIGHLLGRSSFGDEWPHPEVCEIIEEMNDENFNRGFYSGYSNKDDIQVRIGPVTNGSDEHQEAIHLKAIANEISTKYPIVASIIEDLASSKEAWGTYMNKRDKQDN